MGQLRWCAAMLLCWIGVVPVVHARTANAHLVLHRSRMHADDLEIGGDLAGAPAGETRFVTYADLQRLPQVQFRVAQGTTFKGPVLVTGVRLEELERAAGAKPGSSMLVAICTDRYNAHYTEAYVRAHHPVLVLRVNGLDHAHWPRGSEQDGMGPYLILHDAYKPGFKVLSHDEEEQVPWGVVRLDLRRETDVYSPIEPRATSTTVHQGYVIARENCFRCHNRQGEGGTKAGVLWSVVASIAVAAPDLFAAYVRNPTKVNPSSQMAASPEYDDATIDALRAYFQPFASAP